MFLIRQFIFRHLAKQWLRAVVAILGIALGVAVVVSVQMANAGSLRGFEMAIETLSGKAALEIVGAGPGLEEIRLSGLGWLAEYGQVSPVLEGEARFQTSTSGSESLRVLGIDILSDRSFRDYRLLEFDRQQREPSTREFLDLLIDPTSVILTEKFAVRFGLAVGNPVTLILGDHLQNFVIRGLLRNEGPARAMDGNLAVMDIAAAQLALNRLGRLDRLELLPNPGPSLEALRDIIQRRLPPGLRVERPARRGQQVEKMLQAFHFNLTALSYIALLVGLFLIYNTISVSVISRRQEIGVLRSLGTARGTIVALFLAEASALAVAGILAGLPLARLMALGALRITATTVKTLYVATAAQAPPLDAGHWLLAFGSALPLALLAAAVPALEASHVPPVAAMHGAGQLEIGPRFRWKALWLPFCLFVSAGMLCCLKPVGSLPVFGYAAALAIVLGAAFLCPSVLHAARWIGEKTGAVLLKGLPQAFVEWRLAMANLASSIPRIAISVAALAVSLSMLAAIAVMIGSFRETVIYWVEQTLRADLYLRPTTRSNVSVEATVSPEVEEAVRRHPQVAGVDRFRNFTLPYDDGLVTLGAGDFSVLLQHGKLLIKDPSGNLDVLRNAIGQDAVVVSESFSLKHSVNLGGHVTLAMPSGSKTFQVVAVYYDYSNDRGVVVMDQSTLVKHFGPIAPTSLTIYLRPGASPEATRAQILKSLESRHRVFIYTNSALRAEVLRIFDSTFSITYALELIAIFVAILGIASALLTLILERARELAILRMIGADQGQVRRMVVAEALMLGGVSQCIGLGVGLLLSLVLIYVINVQSFGWTIQFHLPVGFLAQSSLLILIAAGLAGLYPARCAARMRAVEALLEE
ncbi:MAG: ABC transporter permease [Acidobacteria bacterium]|nr:ABC transporter permease [Acidobacteriota bacterium]MCI0721702.1 ABC transporter permease [Acidobacteriota bacterium]